MRVKQGLIVETMNDGGCLIVDEAAGRSHALQPEAATVWACLEQGVDRPDDIVETASLDAETVHRALIELAECELIESDDRASRRDVLSKAAAVAGAAAGLELVHSIVTPTPAAAQSERDSATPV